MNGMAMLLRLVRRLTFCAALAFATQSCAWFSHKPPLPKHASIEGVGPAAQSTDFDALVASADVIYFPRERTAAGARSEPGALLLEAMEKTGQPFAIAWDLIDATQQPLLDLLLARDARAREEAVAQFDLIGSGRAREHCRFVLRSVQGPQVTHLAMRFPAAFITKLAAGGKLTGEEERLMPRGYAPPPGGFDAYAERMAASDRGNASLARLYEIELVRRQFAAETIVAYRRRTGGKLLAFCSEADLDGNNGIPYFVAQKINARQLVFGTDQPRAGRAPLLTAGSRTSFEIVDRSPGSAGD